MSGGIYLLQEDRTLLKMTAQPFESENHLQTLLADYPDLLAGDESSDGGPQRRWLLIRREAPVPVEEGGAGWWAVDHLFVDLEGVPTLVEVKRSSDTRIRREVVGQMLDYAANAVVYCPVESIVAQFGANCQARGVDTDAELRTFLGEGADSAGFWQRVKTNLQAGRIRLVFVADAVPAELARVVEFLNSQMDPAEVLAVEVRQYAAGGRQVLAPRLIGQTAEARRKKGVGAASRIWDASSFYEEVGARGGEEAVTVARAVEEAARAMHLVVDWGGGPQSGRFRISTGIGRRPVPLVSVWTYPSVEVLFEYMRSGPPFDQDGQRLALLERLNAIPRVALPEDSLNRRPSFNLMLLRDPAARQQFLDALSWADGEVRAARHAVPTPTVGEANTGAAPDG